MSLVMISKVKKSYGDRLILDIKKFEIIEGDRVGLVGENGCGKTTLIKLLIGEVEAEEGVIELTDSYSYISQKEDYIGKCKKNKVKKVFNAPDEYEDYLSGGEKVKLRIAKALSENKSFIIGDEPTSNLDSKSIEVLEDMLRKYKGSLLLVSHDRGFLDILCNSIVEIEDGKLKVYKGNYSKYIEQKCENRKREEKEYYEYKREKVRLENAILKKECLRDGIKKAPKGMGKSEAKTIKMGDQNGKKNLDGNIKAIKSRMDHLEVKERPKIISEVIIKVKPGMEIVSKNPIKIEGLKLFVGDKLLLDEVNLKIKKGKKIALIGENGCGKSTLLKEILKYNNENIKVVKGVSIGYFDQSQSILAEDKSILENIKEGCSYDESFIRVNLSEFGFKGDTVHKIVSNLSGGEKVKVALCKIILYDNNLLILDEPTNYLDVKSMEALESALINTDKTVVLVSHDRKFISNICNYIIEIKNRAIKEFDGSYKEYIDERNKMKISKGEKDNKDVLLVLENRLSELIFRLSTEINSENKKSLDMEYVELLKSIKRIKG